MGWGRRPSPDNFRTTATYIYIFFYFGVTCFCFFSHSHDSLIVPQKLGCVVEEFKMVRPVPKNG